MFLKFAFIIFAAPSIVAASIAVKRQAGGVVTCNLLVSPQSEVPPTTNLGDEFTSCVLTSRFQNNKYLICFIFNSNCEQLSH